MDELAPALALIRKFEGCKLSAYQDLVLKWTIGYGTTHGVYPGQYISAEQAETMLLADCSDLSQKIRSVLHTDISNNQLCALISFAYNLGFGALFHSSLLTRVNAGEPKDICAGEFMKWNHAGGKIVAGLTARREAESTLFMS